MQTNANSLRLDRQRAVVRDEIQVRQARGRRHDLGARDDEAAIGFLLDVHVDVLDFVERLVAIDRRVDDRVVDERHLVLDLLVPAARIVLIRRVVVGVGAERREEGGLVVGAAADPAVRDARPLGDGVTRADELLGIL